MINRHHLPLAVYYEHPEWFRPLFVELDRRSIQYVRVDAGCHGYDATAGDIKYALLFNRMSASAYLRGNAQGIFFTRDYLAHLERIGTRVINGCKAFSFEISKAAQLALLHSLGLATPRSRIVNCAIEVISAAEEIGFPVIIKPNIGGRGAGIIRLDSAPELAHAAAAGTIGFGIDGTVLVQEFLPVRDGNIARVETLGGKFLYAIKVYPSGENFNLCPAKDMQDRRRSLRREHGPNYWWFRREPNLRKDHRQPRAQSQRPIRASSLFPVALFRSLPLFVHSWQLGSR